MKKIIIGLFVALFVLIGLGVWFYIWSIDQITIEDIGMSKVESVSSDSFIMDGQIYVNNPSIFSLTIDKVDYKMVLKRLNQTLGTGSIPGKKINANSVTKLSFSEEIKWQPSLNVMLDLLRYDKTIVRIEGEVHSGRSIRKFVFDVDIKPYIKDYIDAKIRELQKNLNL